MNILLKMPNLWIWPSEKHVPSWEHFMRSDALRAFRKWDEKEDKIEY